MTTSNTTIKPALGSVKKRKRVGRGNASGYGGECGRGHKGQKSRSGYSQKRGFEGGQNPLYRRLPKLANNKSRHSVVYELLNIKALKFDTATTDTQDSLELSLAVLRDLFSLHANRPVKILGDGDVDRPLAVYAHAFSKTAQEKIIKAGGSVHIVSTTL
mgnify:CR=1 FL=1